MFLSNQLGFRDELGVPKLEAKAGEPFRVQKTNLGVLLLFAPGLFDGGLNLSQLGFNEEKKYYDRIE